MKKTLTALLVMACCTAGAETLTLLPALDSATRIDSQPTSWNEGIGNSGISADAVAACLTTSTSPLLESGWHWGLANTDDDKPEDLTMSETGFSFYGRRNYGGEYVAATVKVEDLLGGEEGVVSSITISFDATVQTSMTFSAWVWDGTTATALIEAGNPGTSFAETVTGLSLEAGNTLLFVYGDNSGGGANTISNLTSSYTLATVTVPEPATATLSLLALAGLAARRRRK